MLIEILVYSSQPVYLMHLVPLAVHSLKCYTDSSLILSILKIPAYRQAGCHPVNKKPALKSTGFKILILKKTITNCWSILT